MSGYFPAEENDKGIGEKLTAARKLIAEAIESWHESKLYLNVEDAAEDGSYIAYLGKATLAISNCLKVNERDADAVLKELRSAEQALVAAEMKRDHWQAILRSLESKHTAAAIQDGIKKLVEG